jgi:cytochrome c oxidase subunit IV
MAHGTYEEQKALVIRGLIVLGIITIIEVMIALLGNGHLIEGISLPKLVMYPLMIGMSLYKAYFIVYYFMHMAYEVKGLRWSVLIPTVLLVWAVIAFFQEGNAWKTNREKIEKKNSSGTGTSTGYHFDEHTCKTLVS